MTRDSVAQAARPSRRARGGQRLMPASEVTDGKRQWMLGEIALWVAARDDRRVVRFVRSEPAAPVRRNVTSDADLLDACRRIVKTHGASISVRQVWELLQAEGAGAAQGRIAPALMRARIEHVKAAMVTGTGSQPSALESVRGDGLVYGVQIARAFDVTEGAVTHARERGHLTGKREGDRWVYDPQRLAVRADGMKGPVDRDSGLAVDMELD